MKLPGCLTDWWYLVSIYSEVIGSFSHEMSTIYYNSRTCFFFFFFYTVLFYHDDMIALSKWHWDTTATTLISTIQYKGLFVFLCNCSTGYMEHTLPWIIHWLDTMWSRNNYFIFFLSHGQTKSWISVDYYLFFLPYLFGVCFLSTWTNHSFLLIKHNVFVLR